MFGADSHFYNTVLHLPVGKGGGGGGVGGGGWGGGGWEGCKHDELPLESRLKYSHHQLSSRLSHSEVFAFSLAAANGVSPPLCLRPSPPFPRWPTSQWEAEDSPTVGQSARSCYVGGRIDKRGEFFSSFCSSSSSSPCFFFTSSHYSRLIGCRQETLLPAKTACRLQAELLNTQALYFSESFFNHHQINAVCLYIVYLCIQVWAFRNVTYISPKDFCWCLGPIMVVIYH